MTGYVENGVHTLKEDLQGKSGEFVLDIKAIGNIKTTLVTTDVVLDSQYCEELTVTKLEKIDTLAVTNGYIFYIPASDYASRMAKAIVNIGKGSTSSLYVYDSANDKYVRAINTEKESNIEGETLYIMAASDDYVAVSADSYWRSSYATTNKPAWTGAIYDVDNITTNFEPEV